MYDYLIIDKDLLPLSDEEKKDIGEKLEWQTKDFENMLTEIYITKDGELKMNTWTYEVVPREERPYPDSEGIKGLSGSLRRTNEKLVTLNYHGIVNFYGYVFAKWYEFYAKFTDGKLENITGGRTEHV